MAYVIVKCNWFHDDLKVNLQYQMHLEDSSKIYMQISNYFGYLEVLVFYFIRANADSDNQSETFISMIFICEYNKILSSKDSIWNRFGSES